MINSVANIDSKIIIKRNVNDVRNDTVSNGTTNISNNTNIEKMFERILNITEQLNSKIDNLDKKINDKMEELNYKVSKLELSLNISNNSNTTEECENLRELVKEKINIDKKDVLTALSYRNYRSILYIFRLYYKNENEKYPIRLFKVRKYEYYANKKWNPDLYGNHSIDVLMNNIQDLFIRYNDINTMQYDEFIMNQDFITQLDNEKTRKSIFKAITDEIRE